MPVGRGAGCTESTDPNEMRAWAMDGASHKSARSRFGRTKCARRVRYKDVPHQSTPNTQIFSSSLPALYFNKLAGRPLPFLHDNAQPRITQSRKFPAIRC